MTNKTRRRTQRRISTATHTVGSVIHGHFTKFQVMQVYHDPVVYIVCNIRTSRLYEWRPWKGVYAL